MGALGTSLGVAGGVAALVLIAWPVAIWWEVKKCEKPKYTVIRTLESSQRGSKSAPKVELRRYAPFLMAQVTLEEVEMRDALSKGFRQIAGFIFGNNTGAASSESEKVAMTSPVVLESRGTEDGRKINKGKGEKIAMTSPVTTEMSDGKYVVSFVMPSKYTKETLPVPCNANIVIQEVPSHTLAALSWRGKPPREDTVEAKKAELLSVLKDSGVEVEDASKTLLYQYYPPFAPNWMRLQEVLLRVKD